MLHNEYETVLILRPDLDDAVTYASVEKLEKVVTESGGHLLLRDDWGKRKLAYPIQKHLKGHYVLLSHLAPPDLVNELERRIRIDDSILRFLTVKLADAVNVPERIEQMEEVRRKRAEEEAARAARAEAEASDDQDDDTSDDSDE